MSPMLQPVATPKNSRTKLQNDSRSTSLNSISNANMVKHMKAAILKNNDRFILQRYSHRTHKATP